MRAKACDDCAAYAEHCHGSLLIHRDGSLECSDDTCDTPAESHEHVVDCFDVTPPCGCP